MSVSRAQSLRLPSELCRPGPVVRVAGCELGKKGPWLRHQVSHREMIDRFGGHPGQIPATLTPGREKTVSMCVSVFV